MSMSTEERLQNIELRISLNDKIARVQLMIEQENYVDGNIALTFELSKVLWDLRSEKGELEQAAELCGGPFYGEAEVEDQPVEPEVA